MDDDVVLSKLGHSWFVDIDGTIVKHNGYKIDGKDTLLSGVADFWSKIPEEDSIILLTSRKPEYKEMTETFLRANGIRFSHIIYGLPYGERILINDDKPSGMKTGIVIGLQRDEGIKNRIIIDDSL